MQICEEAYGTHPVGLMLYLYFNQSHLLEYVLSVQDYSFQKVKSTAYFWRHQDKLYFKCHKYSMQIHIPFKKSCSMLTAISRLEGADS